MKLTRLRNAAMLAVVVALPALTCSGMPAIVDLLARVDALERQTASRAGSELGAVSAAPGRWEFATARLVTAGRVFEILVGDAEEDRGADDPVVSVAVSIDD